jgi:Nitrous oxide-stimulated promoter
MMIKNSLYFEKKTLIAMISIYCESVHRGKILCDECSELREYAIHRIERCMFGPGKPACDKCPVHCYSPERREEIRKVMKFSGPVMLYKHPALAILHLIKEKKTNQKLYLK